MTELRLPRLREADYRRSRRSDGAALPLGWTLPLAALLLAFPAAAQTDTASPSNQADTVDEEITVVETSLLLDFGGRLSTREVRRLKPREVRISEANVPRPSLRLTPAISGPDESWHFLIYIDAGLATQETVSRAALAVAQQAPLLTRLGEVRVVVADERSEELVRPTRSVTRITDALTAVAKQTVGRDRIEGLRRRFAARLVEEEKATVEDRLKAVAQEVELVRRRADRLLRETGDGCRASVCALLLVSDGFQLDPELYYLGAEWATQHPEAGAGAERAALELAESLAAGEWITVALPLRPPSERDPADEPRGSPHADFEEFRLQDDGAWDGITLRRRRASAFSSLPVDDLAQYLLPVLEPLRMMARETSGAILRNGGQLEGELLRLPDRWRLWYRTKRSLDGQIRAVEATLLRDGKPVRAPLWVDASTPPAVSAARVRGLLQGISEPGELPVTATVLERRESSAKLRVEVRWGNDSPTQSSGRSVPLRISYASLVNGRAYTDHVWLEVPAQPEAETTRHEVDALLAGEAKELAVLVEDLRYRVWGGDRLLLP